jgi:hypothetical protein
MAFIQVNTVIPYACKQRTSLTDGTQFYGCEGFVDQQGLIVFPISSPLERDNEDVQFRGTALTKNLTPLKVYTPTGTMAGDYRATSLPFSFQFYNTIYQYDSIYDVHSTVVSVGGSEITDSNVVTIQTNTDLSSTGGVYYLATSHSVPLQAQIDNDIDAKITTNTLTYGEHPPAWDTVSPFGTWDYRGPMGSDPDGNQVRFSFLHFSVPAFNFFFLLQVAKSDVTVFAYCSKKCNVPIKTIVATRPTIYTAEVVMNGNITLDIFNVEVSGDVTGMLMNLGENYINHYEDGVLYSCGDSFIGLNQPFKIGYLYCAKTADVFPFVDLYQPQRNPTWNPTYASMWIDRFAVK